MKVIILYYEINTQVIFHVPENYCQQLIAIWFADSKPFTLTSWFEDFEEFKDSMLEGQI